jgi:hypothetical protein
MRTFILPFLLLTFLQVFTTEGWSQRRSSHHFLKDSTFELYTEILNPSFEETFFRKYENLIEIHDSVIHWKQFPYPNQTPVTVQVDGHQGFDATTEAYHGEVHLNMVTRADQTYEIIAQKLGNPLQPDKTYYLAIKACLSPNLKSASLESDIPLSFKRPVVLKILGVRKMHHELQTLAITPPIRNIEWKEFLIEFTPKTKVRYLFIHSGFDPLANEAYYGNVSIDYLSDIYVRSGEGEQD